MALCYPSQLYKTSRMPKNIPSPTQAWVSLTGSYSLWYIIQCLYSYSYSFKIISQLIWSLQKCPISLYSSEDSHWLKGFAISTSSDHAVLSLIRLLIMNMFIKVLWNTFLLCTSSSRPQLYCMERHFTAKGMLPIIQT